MSQLVFVESWHIECCGTEFAVGDPVSWPVRPVDRSDPYWEPVLGAALAADLTGSYQSHERDPVPQMDGTVRRIRTVSCRYAPLPSSEDQRTLHPVRGTTVVDDVPAIDKWYGDALDPEAPKFCGWLVDLEVSA